MCKLKLELLFQSVLDVTKGFIVKSFQSFNFNQASRNNKLMQQIANCILHVSVSKHTLIFTRSHTITKFYRILLRNKQIL